MGTGYALHLAPNAADDRVDNALASIGWVGRAVLLALAAWVVVQVRTSAIQPFIYFQF